MFRSIGSRRGRTPEELEEQAAAEREQRRADALQRQQSVERRARAIATRNELERRSGVPAVIQGLVLSMSPSEHATFPVARPTPVSPQVFERMLATYTLHRLLLPEEGQVISPPPAGVTQPQPGAGAGRQRNRTQANTGTQAAEPAAARHPRTEQARRPDPPMTQAERDQREERARQARLRMASVERHVEHMRAVRAEMRSAPPAPPCPAQEEPVRRNRTQANTSAQAAEPAPLQRPHAQRKKRHEPPMTQAERDQREERARQARLRMASVERHVEHMRAVRAEARLTAPIAPCPSRDETHRNRTPERTNVQAVEPAPLQRPHVRRKKRREPPMTQAEREQREERAKEARLRQASVERRAAQLRVAHAEARLATTV